MTEYHIKTPTEKDGPCSVEELKKKKMKPERIISDYGAEKMPAGKVASVSPMLNEAHGSTKQNSGMRDYSITGEAAKEPASKSKMTILQFTAFVLLILNGAVYYYKQQNPPADKQVKLSTASAAVKRISANRVPVKQKPQNTESQVTAMADSKVQSDTTIRIRNNWSTFIKAVPSDFKHYKRGGIYQLKAIVQNQTAFPLDTVKLAVNYIRRGQTFKTEFLTLVNIPEHGEVSVPAPDSRGGTAVKVDVTEIRSQKMDFFYNAGLQAEGKADPYFRL